MRISVWRIAQIGLACIGFLLVSGTNEALARFIREGAQDGLWGDQITPNMMAPG
jgi:hypothetical protein